MRAIRWILTAVIVIVGALAVLPFVLPAETIRGHVIAQVEAATDLSVRVDGPVRFSVWPLFDLVAEDITVARDDELELQAARVRVGLAVAPLLSGNARITEFALEAPVLIMAAGGDAAGADDGAPASGSSALANLSVERFSIADGTAILLSADGGAPTRIEAINATMAMPGMDRPTRIEARARHDGREFAVDGTLDSPARLLDGQDAQMSATLSAEGLLSAPVEVSARVRYSDLRLGIADLTASSGDSRIEGWAEAVFFGTPYLEAQLSGALLDIDALLLQSDAGGNRQDPSAAAGSIDFTVLSAFAADLEISVDALRVSGLDLRPARLTVAVDDGVLSASVARLGVAGGTVSGAVRVDPSGDIPVVNGSLDAGGLDIAALAPFIPAPYTASGRLGADIRFATAGHDAAEFRTNANIAGEIAVTGATVTGLGLAESLGDAAADRVDDLAVTVALTDIREPALASGSGTWRGERLELSATGALAPLMAGERSQIDAKVTSRRFTAGYRGGVTASGAADGDVSLETASLRGLLGWLGRGVDVPAGLERFAISGKLDLSASALAFNNASLTLDDTTGTGSGRVTFSARPKIEATLALDRLDVNPYLGTGQGGGGAAAADWSDAPIDLTGLRAFDAQLDLKARTLIYDSIEVSDAELAVSVADGRLAAELKRLAMYDGAGTGQVSVDASAAAPALSARFRLSDLNARPFLRAAADFRRIEGRADIELDLKTAGASQRAMISALAGSAGFKFRDGAIRGIDIPRLATALSDGILAGWQSQDGDRTEFYELAADFAIENGIARNDNLRLVGPLVNVTGAGSVAMPSRSLDFRVEPRVRRQRNEEEVGFGVPVVISGSWSSPRIYPDIRGILENPAAAYEQLRSLGGGIFRAPAAAQIQEQVRERTGIDLEAVTRDGRVDREAVMEEAVRGLERMIERPRDESRQEPEGERQQPSASDQLQGLFRQLIR